MRALPPLEARRPVQAVRLAQIRPPARVRPPVQAPPADSPWMAPGNRTMAAQRAQPAAAVERAAARASAPAPRAARRLSAPGPRAADRPEAGPWSPNRDRWPTVLPARAATDRPPCQGPS